MSSAISQPRPEATTARAPVSFAPRFDLWEDDNEFVLIGDLPGVEQGDLEVQFEKQELRIHGKVAPRKGQAAYVLEEYGVGDFYRTFGTGETIDSQAIHAELTDGVLKVHLPKREETRARRIEVKGS
jgi:HSP20 family molecular chaperone IbpA